MADDLFRQTIRGKLKGGSDEQKDAFVAMCIYRNGGYDDKVAFAKVRTQSCVSNCHVWSINTRLAGHTISLAATASP